ncbi:MAG: hypothetical protein RBR97_19735 [Bacteroidales bacterium]|nr:hypothetical protein [Bacteroidales bacterium]
MSKPLEKITKEYPKRGPLGQYRFDKSISFTCFRCGQIKISKLITIYNENWDKRLCNGCYGRLLSIYDIKAGQTEIDEKAEQLLTVLTKLVDDNQIREKTKRINIQLNKTNFLSPISLRFLATSECVAETLTKESNLDWSPAIIGLCKAFELELLERLINPLKEFCKSIDFTEEDLKDKDFGKIANYCSGKPIKPPELGVVNHFIRTAVNSKERLENSNFLKLGFKRFMNLLPNHNWIIDSNGLSFGIQKLTSNFRNKAAHTDELEKFDYDNCKEMIFGEKGIMWELIISSDKKIK